jgi:hypothetical protein
MRRRPKKPTARRPAVCSVLGRVRTVCRLRGLTLAAGEKRVLPSAEVAERPAAEPLKAKVRQRPADSGLSSDESKLIDLVDQPVTPPQAARRASPS